MDPLAFLTAADAALVSTVALLTFIGVNLARRAIPTLDGRVVPLLALGLSLLLTLLLLLYGGAAWDWQAVGRVGLVALLGAGLSMLGAESYKAQLVNRLTDARTRQLAAARDTAARQN